MISYPKDKVLELCYAAYRYNGGKYIKATQRFSEDMPTVWSNKELVKTCALMMFPEQNQHQPYIPVNFPKIEITEADVMAVEQADRHFKRYTMLSLGSDLSDFQKDIFETYCLDHIGLNRIGFAAYIPEFVNRELHDLAFKRRIKQDFSESSHLNIKHFDGEVEILKCIPLKLYDTHLYVAGVDGNLLSFSNKNRYNVGDIYHLSARYKSSEFERDTNVPITKLNYAKINKVGQ